MSHLQYFNYSGFGERSKKDLNYSQAVRIGNVVQVSGQGGWDRLTEVIPTDIATEVEQAFDNVAFAIQQAGGKGWEQVYKTRVFWIARDGLTFEEIVGFFAKALKTHCPNHGPLCSFIEVKGLYAEMKIEIEASAHLG